MDGHHFERQRRHRHWAHAPAIYVASHVDHEKRFVWFSISLHACGSVPTVVVLIKVTNDLSKTVDLAKLSSNFADLAVSYIQLLCTSHSLKFFTIQAAS